MIFPVTLDGDIFAFTSLNLKKAGGTELEQTSSLLQLFSAIAAVGDSMGQLIRQPSQKNENQLVVQGRIKAHKPSRLTWLWDSRLLDELGLELSRQPWYCGPISSRSHILGFHRSRTIGAHGLRRCPPSDGVGSLPTHYGH